MGLLSRFDLSTDFTQFFLGGLILLMIITVLLGRVAPTKKDKKRGGKVDDRFRSFNGELID